MSLWQIHLQKKSMRQQVKRLYRNLARKLIDLIPKELDQVATDFGWNQIDSESKYPNLPAILEEIAAKSSKGEAYVDSLTEYELLQLGFKNFNKALNALQRLKTNWTKMILINISTRDDPRTGKTIKLKFKAAEWSPRLETDDDLD